MHRFLLILATAVILAQNVVAQTRTPGAGTLITNAQIEAAIKQGMSSPVSDNQVRVVNIDGEYNIGVAAVSRAKRSGPEATGALTHSEVAEVYQVISGNGTLVIGGSMENAKPSPADSRVVKELVGPGMAGGTITNGVDHKLGPGDVIIVPPGAPHWFREITSDRIVYLVFRIDPHKVIPVK